MLSLLNSWDLGTIFGVLGIIITIILFQISQRKMAPYYFIIDFFTLAQSSREGSPLKIFWGDSEVENVNKIQFAFYNSGKKPIKRSNVSCDIPLSIKCPESINLLASYVSKVSRKEIQLDNKDDVKNNVVELRIINDEAFEQKDGFIVDILYTAKSEIVEKEWRMDGRIFGIPKGIKRKNPKNINKIDHIIIFIFSVLLTIFIYIFYNLRENYDKIAVGIYIKYFVYALLFGVILGVVRLFVNNIPMWLKQQYWRLIK